jgi:hypothetical protein
MLAKVQRVLQERDGVIYYILYIKWKGSAQFHLKSIRIQLTYYNYAVYKNQNNETAKNSFTSFHKKNGVFLGPQGGYYNLF